MIRNLRTFGAVTFAVLASSLSQAAPVIYFGENQSPNSIVSGAPATARAAFTGQLVGGVGTETFDAQTTGAVAPLAISFPGSVGSITATITGNGTVFQSPSAAGRFNTTGASVAAVNGKWWQGSDTFNIDFSAAISAFGFYGTDIGDFSNAIGDNSGQLTVSLTDISDNITTLTVNNTVNGSDGALLFWGFVDTTKSYKRVSFGNVGRIDVDQAPDFFGFDDMVIGDLRQVLPPPNDVPEPGTLALLGLAALGAGAARRYRS